MVLGEFVGHPRVQVLLDRVPGSEGEEHRDQAARRAAFQQAQQESDEQHRLAGTRLAEDQKAVGRNALEDMSDVTALPGQPSRTVGPRRICWRPTGPALGQPLDVRPRLDEVCIGRVPFDRQGEGVIEAAYLRFGFPLSAHALGELVGDAFQAGRRWFFLAEADRGDQRGG
ncbi:hypothetical protein ACVB8X_39990 [Streptomyces sp. NRAIS4]